VLLDPLGLVGGCVVGAVLSVAVLVVIAFAALVLIVANAFSGFPA